MQSPNSACRYRTHDSAPTKSCQTHNGMAIAVNAKGHAGRAHPFLTTVIGYEFALKNAYIHVIDVCRTS